MVRVVAIEEDNDFAATKQEIDEYAESLGMNLEEDEAYLWIAEAGLKSPVPAPWRMYYDADAEADTGRAEIFFFNSVTGENTWDHPCDPDFRNLFLEEKARNEPCLVVALHAALAESGVVEVSAIGMTGDTLATLPVKSSRETLFGFEDRLGKELGERIRMILPDGMVFNKSDRETFVGELFGFKVPDEAITADGTWSSTEAWTTCAGTAPSAELFRAAPPGHPGSHHFAPAHIDAAPKFTALHQP